MDFKIQLNKEMYADENKALKDFIMEFLDNEPEKLDLQGKIVKVKLILDLYHSPEVFVYTDSKDQKRKKYKHSDVDFDMNFYSGPINS